MAGGAVEKRVEYDEYAHLIWLTIVSRCYQSISVCTTCVVMAGCEVYIIYAHHVPLGVFFLSPVLCIGYEELKLTHEKMKDAMMSQEQQREEHAKLEMEAKAQEEKVRKELQLKSAELAATNKALLEAKQQHLGTKDHADLLEKSYRQLQSEYESSEALIATQREEHATQQKQLQKMTATMSASTSDRAAVFSVEQRRLAAVEMAELLFLFVEENWRHSDVGQNDVGMTLAKIQRTHIEHHF